MQLKLQPTLGLVRDKFSLKEVLRLPSKPGVQVSVLFLLLDFCALRSFLKVLLEKVLQVLQISGLWRHGMCPYVHEISYAKSHIVLFNVFP